MKAMILAAGRGMRMRPLTDHTHKGLLKVAGVPMLEQHVKHLSNIGIKDIVINVSYLAEQIQTFLGTGQQYGVKIRYSIEEMPLEVGGGIIKALPLLGVDPFITINCDVWTDFPLQSLAEKLRNHDGHIVLVNNPEHRQQGDFHLNNEKVELLNLTKSPKNNYTFSGIAIYHPRIFADFSHDCLQPMLPILKKAIQTKRLSGEYYQGMWNDIGTPERLAAINENTRSF